MVVKTKILIEKYQWHRYKNVFVTGFVWINQQYVSGAQLAELFYSYVQQKADFETWIWGLNGQFSLVVDQDRDLWLLCDHTWSFPIFYCQKEGCIVVSDNPHRLLQELPTPRMNSHASNYFLMLGVSPGNDTLVEGICQVNAGEWQQLGQAGTTSLSMTGKMGKQPISEAREEDLQQLILSVFDKYGGYLKNRPVLLPLTAGYDSRILASLLKMWGHQNVLCATWGRAGNPEIETAARVAKQLGYQHLFMEYNSELIAGFSQKPHFLQYADYAGHLSSMPFAQDYFAVHHLLHQNIISPDTVVLPGHSGDFFAGSHLDTGTQKGQNTYLLTRIFDKLSSSYPHEARSLKEIERRITKDFLLEKDKMPWQKFERWDFHERQCKLIANSNQVYRFLGLEVLMPLFDRHFIDFFAQVPFAQKLGASLYNSTLEHHFFSPLQLDFARKKLTTAGSNWEPMKKTILKYSPRQLKKWYYPMTDPIFYREITAELRQLLPKSACQHPQKPHFYNAYLIQWYLHRVQQKVQQPPVL